VPNPSVLASLKKFQKLLAQRLTIFCTEKSRWVAAAVWHIGNGVGRISEATLRWDRLVGYWDG